MKKLVLKNVPVEKLVHKVQAFRTLYESNPIVLVKGVFVDKEGDTVYCTDRWYYVDFHGERKVLDVHLNIEKAALRPVGDVLKKVCLYVPPMVSTKTAVILSSVFDVK